MKVYIDGRVFQEADTPQKTLKLTHVLGDIFDDNRHRLLVDDPQMEHTAFFQDAPIFQELLKESFAATVTADSANSNQCKVTTDGEQESEQKIFNPDEAHQYLSKPFAVFVENSLNDAYFLKALFTYFDDAGSLRKRLEKQWIKFENCGGCANLQNELTAVVSTLPQRKIKFLHGYILLDSDKRYEGAPLTPQQSDNMAFARSLGLSVHMLEKRAMENYMPDEIVREILPRTSTQWIDAYMSLSEKQKDYFCTASGFRKDLNNGATQRTPESRLTTNNFFPEQKEFYADLPEPVFRKLIGGSGLRDFKKEFPKGFEHERISKETLLRRTRSSNLEELQQIVNDILALV